MGHEILDVLHASLFFPLLLVDGALRVCKTTTGGTLSNSISRQSHHHVYTGAIIAAFSTFTPSLLIHGQ